jgi:hypothetical protein
MISFIRRIIAAVCTAFQRKFPTESTGAARPIDKAIEILGATRDGDQLDRGHLRLVEAAVNGHLTEAGLEALERLRRQVAAGEYQRRWFHGIEHLTQDHHGYVLWKGTEIEHYSFSDAAREKEAATALAERCRSVEARGFPVNGRTTCTFSAFVDAPAGTPWVDAMLKSYTAFAHPSGAVKWLILSVGNDAIAVSVLDANDVRELRLPTSCIGEVSTLYETGGDYDSGQYRMYHRLARLGLVSASRRLETYRGFVDAMKEARITPEVVQRAINAGVPAVQKIA